MTFPSKQALLRAFQIDQHIADTPHKWYFLPWGNQWSHQAQHWDREFGILLAPMLLATAAQMAGKEEMITGFIKIAELATRTSIPFSLDKIVFGQHSIISH